jgi:hypothetical protein
VTSGAHLSERPGLDPPLHGEFEQDPLTDSAFEPDRVGGAPASQSAEGRTARIVRAGGFHLGVIAAFAVPAVVLWWHVWSGNPSATLTCGCGDPAQQVWFTAWPAWAIAHLHNPFFSSAVNVPFGANLLSNTSGPLIGAVLAPVTWAFGPIVATNVGLVLAPALSAWGCFIALRSLVRWWPGAVVAGLAFGYSAAVVTSLEFGHLSVTVLAIPPLLFAQLHEILVRQERTVRRDGLVLAALLIVQFLISPEVLVMCGLLAAIGLVVTVAAGWRRVPALWPHAARALGLGLGLAAVALAYPAWFGQAGPQAVTGVLFVLAPFTGVPLSGVVAPGQYATAANVYIRFGGYLGHNGPPSDYLGGGALVAAVAGVVLARRRPLTWLMLFMSLVTLLLALGDRLKNGPAGLAHVWLPWLSLSTLPLLKEILPDQFAPFLFFFVGALVALGLDALAASRPGQGSWLGRHLRAVIVAATAGAAVLVLVPVFATFDVPLRTERVTLPPYMTRDAPELPSGTVVLTVPFPVSGTAQPMLWQAVDDLRFRLAGAALKTPNKEGGPVARGLPGSARHILTSLSVAGSPEPEATPDEVAAVLYGLRHWDVDRVVITGSSRDPTYASGFFTAVLGSTPDFVDGAWVWRLPGGRPAAPPVVGARLPACRAAAAASANAGDPLYMARCVLFSAGRAA